MFGSKKAGRINMRPSQQNIKKYVLYMAETGDFYRIGKVGCKGIIGEKVGRLKSHGYIVFQVAGHRDYAHRFAWLYMTGKWPKELDHINGSRNDNRWLNLREATRTQNNANRKLCNKKKYHNLPKGVLIRKNRGGSISYYGRIIVNGKQIWSTAQSNPDNAHKLYMALARKYFGEFARAG